MQKRVHSREFKLDVVRQIVTGQKRPAQACREYGLAESVLSRWRREYQERGEAAFQPQSSGEATSEAQRIAELERFCGQLALENQVLKKAVQSRGSRSVMPCLRKPIKPIQSFPCSGSVNCLKSVEAGTMNI